MGADEEAVDLRSEGSYDLDRNDVRQCQRCSGEEVVLEVANHDGDGQHGGWNGGHREYDCGDVWRDSRLGTDRSAVRSFPTSKGPWRVG